VDPKPHVGGPVLPLGEPTVLIGWKPAARVGDKLVCVGPPDTISQGEPSVKIGYRDAARFGDATIHGGKITMGCLSVIIGSSPQGVALRTDKPLCEECDKAKKRQDKKRRSK